MSTKNEVERPEASIESAHHHHRTVTLSAYDSLRFAVEPACKDILVGPLSNGSRVWRTDGRIGFHAREISMKFYEFDELGRLLVPRGLLQRVKAVLQGEGVQIEQEFQPGMRAICPPNPSRKIPARFRALRDLHSFARGTIALDSPHEMPKVLGAIGDLFPTAQIAVCTSTWAGAELLQSQISKHTERLVVIDRDRYVNRDFQDPENHVIQVMAGAIVNTARILQRASVRKCSARGLRIPC
ncbi:MAG: hypothetical protein RJP95_02900 [Pirellulales bacterium]